MQNNLAKLCFFVPLLIMCNSQPDVHKIFETKKLTNKKVRLIPNIVKYRTPVYGISPLVFPNKFAMNFSVCSLSADLQITQHTTVPKFPIETYGNFRSDDSGKIMWCYYRYRNLATLDVSTKKTYEGTPVWIYSDISNVKLFSNDKHLLLIETSGGAFNLFDMLSGRVVKNLYGKRGTFIRYSDQKWLFMEFCNDSNPTHWFWTDMTFSAADTNFPVLFEDTFTKYLTTQSFEVEFRRCGFANFASRKMLGCKTKCTDLNYHEKGSLVTWDTSFCSPRLSVFESQLPRSYAFGIDCWQISTNGKWACAIATPLEDGRQEDEIMFFQIDSKYPLGISPPILGGTSSSYEDGCFVYQTELGQLYIDHDARYPKHLFVYQLNKGLELLKQQAQQSDTNIATYQK